MVTQTSRFKCIVTALVLIVGFSMPAGAATLDELFTDLAQAERNAGARIEKQIIGIWEKSGSASFDFLLKRGKDALEDGDADAALDHFNALVDHAPDFAEAYHNRATAYYLLGMMGLALDDLRQTLAMKKHVPMYGHGWKPTIGMERGILAMEAMTSIAQSCLVTSVNRVA